MSDLFLDKSEGGDNDTVSADFELFDLKQKAGEITKQLNWVFTQRKPEYIEEVLSLSEHKSVQVRRKLSSGIVAIGNKEIIQKLEDWKQKESDRETVINLEVSIDKLHRAVEDDEERFSESILSVSEAVKYLKGLIGEKTFVIEGELSDIKLFQRTGQDIYYLALKDKQESRIDCMLLSKIAYQAGFPINEGFTVRATGKFKLGKQSRLYFEIHKLTLTGEGELLRNLKILEEKLQKEGLFEESRKRQLPLLPRNILLIASPNSAALNDFTKVLDFRRRNVNIYHLPIKTQGVGAEFDILCKLEKVNELTEKYFIDTVVMTRGGGSLDDLFVFNSEKIIRALYSINRPTIVAIGHERDTTLAELVADLRCSTPSQAAEKSSLSNSEVLHQVNSLYSAVSSEVYDKKYRYEEATRRLFYNVSLLIKADLQQAQNICRQVDYLTYSVINRVRLENRQAFSKSVLAVKERVQQDLQNLQSLDRFRLELDFKVKEYRAVNEKMLYEVKENVLSNFRSAKQEFINTHTRISLYDPQNVLKLGYAMISQEGEVIEKLSQIDKQKPVSIKMQDGEGKFESTGVSDF
jgi:exodeoxyribonuclease VII large subunit